MAITAIESVLDAFSRGLVTQPFEDGELMTVPLALASGALVRVYVEQLADDAWLVTDRGQASSELALAGVNLEQNRSAAMSWYAIVRDLDLSPPVLTTRAADYELAGLTSRSTLGESVLVVAEAALRADALRALAPGFRRRRFRDVIIRTAGEYELPVIPDAPMPVRHGGQRRVTCRVDGDGSKYYMQGVSANSKGLNGFDRAQSVLSSADVHDGEVLAVVESGMSLRGWQREMLDEHGRVLFETDLSGFMRQLAAA